MNVTFSGVRPYAPSQSGLASPQASSVTPTFGNADDISLEERAPVILSRNAQQVLDGGRRPLTFPILGSSGNKQVTIGDCQGRGGELTGYTVQIPTTRTQHRPWLFGGDKEVPATVSVKYVGNPGGDGGYHVDEITTADGQVITREQAIREDARKWLQLVEQTQWGLNRVASEPVAQTAYAG